ncbi:MAG TPA: mandelate racemase/muconate lactonizing enzyme family protein [Chloroflexota bacterium]|nr:mandelate racemase/muconate lactonizing enzyme family protein [Chloroflexota bacterium]
MKIAAVRCHALRAPIEDAFYYSQGYYGARGAVLLEVLTDDGLSGWGDCAGDAALLPAYVAAHLSPRLVGRDPRDWQRLWHALGGLGALEGANAPAPVHYGALSGAQVALLDLAGQAAGVPLYRLLGGAFRERIKVYATGLYRLQRWQTLDAWREGLVQEALGYRSEGFSLCKVKIGFRPQDDVRLVHAVREAVGDQMGVAVDANCAWDAATAIRVGRQLESAGVAWFEEPLPPGDLAGYREVRRALAIPVSGGESLAGPAAFREMIQGRAVDIVQPDVAVCGGISTLQRVQALADANGVRLLPHCWGSALSFAASLHYLATVPDGPPAVTPTEPLLEYDRSENPLRDALLLENLRQEGGYLPVPQGPGLGVTVDPKALRRYAV